MAIANFKNKLAFFEQNKWVTQLGWLLFAAIFLVLWWQGSWIQPDSGTYLAKSSIRSALYPLVLHINTFLFGLDNYQALIFFQLALGFFSAYFLVTKLKEIFNLNYLLTFLLQCIFLIPYYGPTKFGNAILTEALCYPLFLLSVAYLFDGALQKKTSSLLYFLGFTSLLILTRRQFLFLYPVFALILIYIAVFLRQQFKLRTLVLSFIITMVGTNLLERSYQYINDGHFTTVPFTGIQMIIAPLYLANQVDVELFTDETERALLQKTHTAMQAKNISFNSINTSAHFNMVLYPQFFNLTAYPHYYESYNTICWQTLSPVLGELKIGSPYEIDKITTHMALTLIKHHPKEYFALYASNIIFNLGGLFYTLFLGLLALMALIQHYCKRDTISLATLITLLLTAGNYSLVALVEPVMRRYSVYTDTLQIGMLLILAAIAFRCHITE